MFGVACSHANQIDLSISASSEIVASQQDIDKVLHLYVRQELDDLMEELNFQKNSSCGSLSENYCVIKFDET